jgi:hypothetical protein
VSESDDGEIPAALSRFRDVSGQPGELKEAACSQGRLARGLSASKPGGLMLNVNAPELGFWLADGMDITSQLINLVHEAEIHDALAGSFADDIRVSVHSQHPIEFLSDVSAHRFDFMAFGAIDTALAELAANSLAPGGILGVFPGLSPCTGTDSETLETVLRRDGNLLVAASDQGTVIAVRATGNRHPARRGGRRKPPR